MQRNKLFLAVSELFQSVTTHDNLSYVFVLPLYISFFFTPQNKLNDLSNATDSLELWVKVQLLWTSLESVFMGGDIAKQMPIEAKKFVKIDKDWAKTMIKGGLELSTSLL